MPRVALAVGWRVMETWLQLPACGASPSPRPTHHFLLQIHTQGRGISEGSHLSLKENGSTLMGQILEATSAWFLIKENLKKVFSNPDRMGTPKEIKSSLKNGANSSPFTPELEIHACCEYLKMLAWDYIIIKLRLGLEAAKMSKNKRAQWQSKPENWGELLFSFSVTRVSRERRKWLP